MMKEYMLLHIAALMTGVLLDLIIGDPVWMPHPIRLIGRYIAWLEERLYKKDGGRANLRRGGLLVLLVLISTVLVTGAVLVGAYLINRYFGLAIEAVLTCYVLAARCLCNESMKVAKALQQGNIAAARNALSMIVGRDTAKLDEAGVTRAAVETVSENTSDGVIAPLLYTAIGGPILGMFYKAVNTMDSMIGYRNERYEYFGRVAAKTDDVMNFIPSRLSALLMILAAFILCAFDKNYRPSNAYRIWIRDRQKHLSPNSAQTESTCAGALGVSLGGPSYYHGKLVDKPFMGDSIREIEIRDIWRSNMLMFATELLPVIITLISII